MTRISPLGFAAIIAVALPLESTAQRADTVVRMAGAPRYAEVATLVEEMSIGVVDGAEEYMFGDIADIAIAKDGSVYVLDRKIYGVRVYDAKGKYTRTIGRKGQGPGEIAYASGIGILPDGRMLVWDTGNWRINVYSASGNSLTQWSMATSGGGSSTSRMSRAMVVDSAGFVYVQKDLFIRPTDGSRPRLNHVWLRLRSTGGVVLDTIAEPAWPIQPRSVDAQNGGSFVTAPVPFDPQPVWTISPLGYLITGMPSRYAFELHNSARSLLSVRRDVKPDPVSAAERDSARKDIEEAMRRSVPGWSFGNTEIPRTRPYYDGILTGLDGRIWIARVPEAAPRIGSISTGGLSVGRGTRPSPNPGADAAPVSTRPALYDVFEPNGTYIAQVLIPARVSTAVRRGDYVWGVAYDSDDVPTVKRYRIVWK